MAAKLGLTAYDDALVTQLLTLMVRSEADYTNTFRALSHVPAADGAESPGNAAGGSNGASSDGAAAVAAAAAAAEAAAADAAAAATLHDGASASGAAVDAPSAAAGAGSSNGSSSELDGDGQAAAAPPGPPPLPDAAAAAAAAAAAGLPAPLLDALTLDALAREPALISEWGAWLCAWRAALRAQGLPDAERVVLQQGAAPKFVPRQHLLQYAIQAAEGGDYSELEALMDVCSRPYDEQPEADPKFSSRPPPDMVRPGVCVLSCSS
jgi:uncharacterized protein YdiU (UPF0061 family)